MRTNPLFLLLLIQLLACASNVEPTSVPTHTATPVIATLTILPATATPSSTPTEPPTAVPTLTPTATATTPPVASDTPEPTNALSSYLPNKLLPAGDVVAFPGPFHYVGDVLTLQVAIEMWSAEEVTVRLTLDGDNLGERIGRVFNRQLIIPAALDLTGLEGDYQVQIEATIDSEQIDVLYPFTVLPADKRPAQEVNARWETTEIACCRLHYLSQTAAARDIDALAPVFQAAADEITAYPNAALTDKFDVYFIDRMIFNGAFGGDGELVVVYTDRDYSPIRMDRTLETVARHEFVHASGLDVSGNGRFYYNEGLAVYLAGGHYKPEPIPARAAAMFELGLGGDAPTRGRHELAYLRGAAIVAFIVEQYGWDALWAYVAAADQFDTDARTQAVETVFGIDSEQFNRQYRDWVRAQTVGEQRIDLDLTIDLQDLRRIYQDRYLRAPMAIFGKAKDGILQVAESISMRESSVPANVAVELMIAEGQRAIAAGEYEYAEQLINAIEATLTDGTFETPLAADFIAITELAAVNGLELQTLQIVGDVATGLATHSAPSRQAFRAVYSDGVWVLSDD